VTVTHERDTEAREPDTAVRLRTEVCDALMASKGITSVAAQASQIGVSRSTLFRLRRGEIEPLLGQAMRMARVAGTTVEALFELRPGGDDRG
jgi:DNA-binding XRE family transcriptional regulator